MKLAMVQMKNSGSMEANLAKSLDAIHKAAKAGADIILFPEVQLTEFFSQYPGKDVRYYRVGIDSETVHSFCHAAKENHIMTVPNLYLEENGKPYDASLLIGKTGDIIGVQKMVHVANAPQFYEQDYYTPADDGFKVFDTELGRIGIVVCFDRHYPESIRTEALKGADLILIPTVNTKAEPSEMFEWEIRVQAFQNSVAVAMCNRVGTEGAMEFSGESLAADANGSLIGMRSDCRLVKGWVKKANDNEQILYVDIDMSEPRKVRMRRPYISLRRPEWYV